MAGYRPEPRRAPAAGARSPRAGSRGTGYRDGNGYRDDDSYRDEGYREAGYRGGARGRGAPTDGRAAYWDDAYRDDAYRGGARGSRAYPGVTYRDSGRGDPFRPGARRPAGRGDRPGGYPGRPTRHVAAARSRDTTGGADGNERLTALAGSLLLALFAAEGVTILAVRQLLTLHFFLGTLLVGPVALKAGSTLYRFARYYSGDPEYRRKGPPAPLLRLLGPFVLITSVSVIGTGIMLAIDGPGAGTWLFLHKATFVLWFGVMTIHVLAYVWRLPRHISGDLAGGMSRAGEVLAGRRARWLLLTASVLAGLLLALMIYQRAGMWTGLGFG